MTRHVHYDMRLSTLVRVGGVAAILAGVLRAASSFASAGSEVERQALYFIVDLLLLLVPHRSGSDGFTRRLWYDQLAADKAGRASRERGRR